MGRSKTACGLGVAALVCALAPAGCTSNPTEPTSIPLGQPFDLRAGSSSSLQGGLTVTFDRVASDSRCPIDVFCFVAGDAVVMLTLSQHSQNREERELHTDKRAPDAAYLTYTIELGALAPGRRSDRPIAPGDYVATLTVKER